MLRLVQLIVLSMLIAASAPLTGQSPVDTCVRFAPDARQLQLVQAVRLSNDNSLSELVKIRQTGSKTFGEFLRNGGSLVVLDDADRTVGVINRDTLDDSALSSAADFVKVSRDAVTEVSRASVPPEAPAAPTIDVTDTHWALDPNSRLGAGTLDLLRHRLANNDPNGMQIGSFDGVPSAQVMVGPFDGRPLQPQPIGLNVSAQSAMVKAVNATVAIYFREKDAPAHVEMCNGIQIGPGLILTNLHCASQRYEMHVVHFGALHLQGDTLLPGSPVTGDVRCRAVVVSPVPDHNKRLDFALLRIIGNPPSPYDRAIADLDDGSELPTTGTAAAKIAAMQIQYWLTNGTTSATRQYEKYVMPPPECQIIAEPTAEPAESFYCNSEDIDPADLINPAGVGHKCDSERGSSGSPIFDPNALKVIALHRGGGQRSITRNCAVPAKSIYNQLQAWNVLGGSNLGGM